jgi:hypothetical protein
MNTPVTINGIPRSVLQTLNHLYEAERKLLLYGDPGGVLRNIERIKTAWAEEEVFYEDPMGQPFNETRTDIEASIAGEDTENLHVTEVIKPVIRRGNPEYSRVIQKGIVVVQSKSMEAGTQEGGQE